MSGTTAATKKHAVCVRRMAWGSMARVLLAAGVVAVTCVAGHVAWVSAAAADAGASVSGGNGVRHFWSADGWADTTSGCDDQDPSNPNLRTGPGHTSSLAGYLWLSDGTLHDDRDGTGTLSVDGSFHLDYPHAGPSELRSVDGKIGSLDSFGQAPFINGTWTQPYPNGESTCLIHFRVTSGKVDFSVGDFGGASAPSIVSSGSSSTMAPFEAAGATAAILGVVGGLAWYRRRRRRCRCSCAATIVGPEVLYLGDPGVVWTLETTAPDDAADDVVLVATVIDPTDKDKTRTVRLEQHYAVDITPECASGQVANWRAHWSLLESADDHVALEVSVTGTVTCDRGSASTVACRDVRIITVQPHCGPDVTDQFIAAVNRLLERMRRRERALIAASDDERDDDDDGDRAEVPWDESDYGPKTAYSFMLSNGRWIQFRAFSQDRAHEAPPFAQPGSCPSCARCGGTVTFLGQCIDNFLLDALLFGVAAAMLDISDITTWLAGSGAKLVTWHLFNPETRLGAQPAWRLGHALGTIARNDVDFSVTEDTLQLRSLLRLERGQRPECRPCSEQVVLTGWDWTSMDWSSTGPAREIYEPTAPKK